MAALEPGAMAPPLRLPDMAGSAERKRDGDALSLLAFFKVTCPTCQLAMPYVERFKQYGAEGLDILAIAEDPAEAARDFAEQHGLSVPVALDLSPYEASAAHGLTNVPTLFLVEPGGKVVCQQVGFSKEGYNTISEEIARRLGAPAIEICPPSDGAPAFKPG